METKNRIEIADISNIKYLKYGRKSKGLSSESVMNLSENYIILYYMIVIAFSYAAKILSILATYPQLKLGVWTRVNSFAIYMIVIAKSYDPGK
jgi:hypothetical protein